MKTTRRLSLAAAFLLSAALIGGGFSTIGVSGEDIPTVVDECEQVSGEDMVAADIYGLSIQSGDVGFGTDGRYATTKAPTAAPDASTMWNEEYAYIQYEVSGQNLVTVTADVDPSVAGVLPPMLCYAQAADGGRLLEVNNTGKESSSNWMRFSYTFIIGENTQWIRVLPTSYNAEDESVASWMQQITRVELKYVSELPPKDEAKPAPVYTDVCNGNQIEGQRSDVYNLDVRGDRSGEIGDEDRIVFGSNPGAAESYIDYRLEGQDTVAVTAYEEIFEGDVRPENATVVKFCLFGTNWEVNATRTEVELGDYEAKRWTKITFYYEIGNPSDGTVRVMIYKPTEGQSEIEIGRIDIYDSATADLTKLHAKQEAERYSFLKGQTNYSTDNWNVLREIMAAALISIDEAETEAVEGILAKAKADMDAILTSEQEFEATKTAKKQEIADYAASKGQDNYTAENWQLIEKAVSDAQGKIDAATSTAQINTAILDAKDEIDGVPRKTVDGGSSSSDIGKDDSDGSGKTSAGCGSTFSSVGVTVLAGAFLAVFRKRRTQK